MRILVDLDGICVNLMEPWLEWYECNLAEDDEEVSVEDITDKIHTIVRGGKKVYDALNLEGWFNQLPELPGAVAAVQKMHDAGHHVVICSSPGNSIYAPSDKTRWVFRHMPFLDKTNMIITHQKHLVNGDILIDDDPEKAELYKEAWPDSQVLAIAWPWNGHGKFDLRAQDYRDTRAAWDEILNRVDELAAER